MRHFILAFAVLAFASACMTDPVNNTELSSIDDDVTFEGYLGAPEAYVGFQQTRHPALGYDGYIGYVQSSATQAPVVPLSTPGYAYTWTSDVDEDYGSWSDGTASPLQARWRCADKDTRETYIRAISGYQGSPVWTFDTDYVTCYVNNGPWNNWEEFIAQCTSPDAPDVRLTVADSTCTCESIETERLAWEAEHCEGFEHACQQSPYYLPEIPYNLPWSCVFNSTPCPRCWEHNGISPNVACEGPFHFSAVHGVTEEECVAAGNWWTDENPGKLCAGYLFGAGPYNTGAEWYGCYGD